MSTTHHDVEDLDQDGRVSTTMTKLQKKTSLEVICKGESPPAASKEHTALFVKHDFNLLGLLAGLDSRS